MQEGRVHPRLRDSVPISGLSLFSFRDCGDPKESTVPTPVAQRSRASSSEGESREAPFDSYKKSHSRQCEQNSRRYRPKHLSWRKPLRNKIGGSAKINRGFEGKGSGTDAQKNAADPIKHFPLTMAMTGAQGCA
jgi:hypothetical protein